MTRGIRDSFEFLGSSYLKYAFTKGTEHEVAFVSQALGLGRGEVIVDVGCGPGRHAHQLARQGSAVVGVDITAAFVALAATGAPPGARFVHGDARRLPLRTATADVVLSLCEGAFGLVSPDDDVVLAEMARVLRPGGRLLLTAVNAYFVTRYQEGQDSFDAAAGVNTERTILRSPAGEEREVDLVTTCFTPRELTLMLERAGMTVEAIHSVSPGDYAARPPDLDHPELLAIATRGAPLVP